MGSYPLFGMTGEVMPVESATSCMSALRLMAATRFSPTSRSIRIQHVPTRGAIGPLRAHIRRAQTASLFQELLLGSLTEEKPKVLCPDLMADSTLLGSTE